MPTSARSQSTFASLAPLLAVVVIALFMQFVVLQIVEPFHARMLSLIGGSIILAVSLTLVNGFTGQFSMGHAGFMAVGGYVAAAVTYYASFRFWGSAAVHAGGFGDALFLLASILGGLAAAAIGYCVALPSLRLRGDYLAIVTLGFGEILRVLLTQTSDVLSDVNEIRDTPWPMLFTKLGGALGFASAQGVPTYTSLFWVYLFVGITLLAAFRLKYSSYGRAFLAIREDEIAAEAMGVQTTKYKIRAFVIAAFFAGLAGSLYAHEIGTALSPSEFGFQKSFDVIIMVVLGGMGSISGAALAAIILTILPETLRSFADFRMVLYALALILMMILRPQGLFGIHEIWERGAWRGRGRKRRAAGEARA